jgi:[acyl-carrier-protein] S-malonyltransferase
VCAGALAFESAVALVAERARLMQEAVPEGQGGMAAVLGLDNDQVAAVCRRASGDEVVEAANLNAPGQVVIAGHSAAVERALVLAREAGAKRSVRLAVSIPSHCSLMRLAAERLGTLLAQAPLRAPCIGVLHNVDAATHPEPEAMRQALAAQLQRPVRWAETVARMAERGIDTLIECGPGRVLAGLTKRIVSGLAAYPVFDVATLEQALIRTAQG